MIVSRRSLADGEPNALAVLGARLRADGVELTDLTDSNPTRHDLGDPAILAALARGAGRANRYEPEPKGPLVAREALAAAFGGEPDDYWLTASTSEAYSWLFHLVADPGETVAVPAPGYPLLEPLAGLAGLATRSYGWFYLHPQGWSLDVADLDRAMAPGVRVLVVVNPGNPTGGYVDPAAREAMIAACERSGAVLIADEVFEPFALDLAHDPAALSLRGEDRVATFTLGGLSKLLAAPQLKLGWIRLSGPAGARAAIGPALDRIADTFLSVGTPVALALPELLELADGAIARIRERLGVNLAQARAVFSDGGYRVRRCDGGWTALLDVPRYVSDDELAEHLLREAHLAVHPGWFYDAADAGLLALSLLPRPASFAASCRRLRTAIDALA